MIGLDCRMLLAAGFTLAVLLGSPCSAAEDRLDHVGLARLIDEQIEAKLKAAGLAPGPAADDAAFLRRIYLDLTGAIPSYDEAAKFLDSSDPEKRARLIDELLERPEFGRHQSVSWGPRLFIDTSRRIPATMSDWLAEQFAANRPWNETVQEIITASGREKDNAPAAFFLHNNTVTDVTEATARAFMGVQLQCVQCHDHPFSALQQDDYWGTAAFYVKLNKYVQRRGSNDIAETDGSRGLWEPPDGFRELPPRFLGGEPPALEKSEPYRPHLAAWLTAPENPFFARAMVNRTWAHFFARGLVNPVDDMIDTNPSSHPRLLRELSNQFVLSGFDVKHLVRSICNSRAYQRSSQPSENPESEEELTLFARMPIRSLTPHQLADSRAVFASRHPGGGFLNYFESREELNPLEYHNGIAATLMMMNSIAGNSTGDLLKTAVDSSAAVEQNLERLWLHILSRRPTEDEVSRYSLFVQSQQNQQNAYRDLVWAMLNGPEFLLNR